MFQWGLVPVWLLVTVPGGDGSTTLKSERAPGLKRDGGGTWNDGSDEAGHGSGGEVGFKSICQSLMGCTGLWRWDPRGAEHPKVPHRILLGPRAESPAQQGMEVEGSKARCSFAIKVIQNSCV